MFTKETAAANGKKSSRKGVPNKSTSEIREAYKDLVNSKIGNLSKWIDKVAKDSPKDAIYLMIQLSKFVLPTLRSSTVESDFKEQRLFEIINLDVESPEFEKINNELENKY